MKKLKKTVIGLMVGVICLLAGCKANINEGLELLEAKKYEEAIVCFEQDIKEGKNLDEAYRGVGIAQFELGAYEASIKALEQALENEAEESAAIYALLGADYLCVEEYEKALENYARALLQEDCSAELEQEILFNEIAVCQEMGEWDTVKEKAEFYVKQYPEDERMEKTMEFLESR